MTADARVSVVIATFNRRASLERLLRQLAGQTLPLDQFEVIIVDDGSSRPAPDWVPELRLPYRVVAVRQANAGAAAARHRAIQEAGGEVLVVTDDDMQVTPTFLAAHLSEHGPGLRRIVVGRIRSSSKLQDMPLFERFHADLLDRWAGAPLHGDAVCTGNVSLRRADYMAVGGFDASLERAEDIDLGLRLEQAGAEVLFSEEAFTVHESDHSDFAVWRRRAIAYGRCWTRIGHKNPRLIRADPWHAFFEQASAKIPFVVLVSVFPVLGPALSWVTQRGALSADRLGLERVALRLTSLLWALEFFRGVRGELGSLAATARSWAAFLEKAETASETPEGVGYWSIRLGRLVRAVLPTDSPAPGPGWGS